MTCIDPLLYSFTMEGIVSFPSLSSFSSTISICASLDHVTDNSSLTYPTFCLTVVFEFALLMFSDKTGLVHAVLCDGPLKQVYMCCDINFEGTGLKFVGDLA